MKSFQLQSFFMENEIKKLTEYYGSEDKVADILGITWRHLWGIRTGRSNPGKPLEKLIHSILKQIELTGK